MSYKTVRTDGQGEIEVKKSRFIATTHPISSEQEAQDFLASVRKKYRDARHNCYAYTAGRNFELQRSSDDGEPSGTAGRPILELLLNEEIHDCVIVVTRYFGGTLLGTGGLIRAYQAAAREGLKNSVIIDRRDGTMFTVRCDYNSLGRLQSLAAEQGFPVCDTRYTDVVEMDLIAPEEAVDTFITLVTEATSGKAQITRGEQVGYADADGELLLFESERGDTDVQL